MKNTPLLLLVPCLVALIWPETGTTVLQVGSRTEHGTDVTQHGAQGDGKTDDTRAIQSAVDAEAGSVRFPKGVYRITKTIEVDLDRLGYTALVSNGEARIEMAGKGPAFRFVGTHLKSADPGGFEQRVWDRQRMPMIDGLAIVGQHPESIGIEAIGTMQLTIVRTHIRKTLHAIRLAKSNRNVNIADCHIYENTGVAIYYDDVNLHQSNITSCHISYNDQGGIVARKGNVRNIHITGCDIESNMSPDYPQTANVLIDCRGSRYGTGEVAITGCTIQHNHRSTDSANVRIIGNSDHAVDGQRQREGNITITGNVFSDVEVNVHLQQCRGVTLVGNTFWMGFKHNLLMEDCNSVVIGANNMDRNPRYDYGDSLDARNSVVMRGCQDCTISGLHLTNVWGDRAALTLENCQRMHLGQSTILDSDHVGLLMIGVRNSRINDLLVRDDRAENPHPFTSIRIEGGQGNIVMDNVTSTEIERADPTSATLEGNRLARQE